MLGRLSEYALVPVVLNCNGMRRWSLLTVCVVEDMRTSANEVTAELVPTAMLVPWVAAAGALLMTGRVAALPLALSR